MTSTPACPEIIGHRGSPDDAPENTLASVRLAWERGADAVEVDVRLTLDDQLIVLHDADTRRITGVAGVPEQMTLGDLRTLDAGAWKGSQFAGEKLPTLDEVLATGGEKRRFFIEIKRGPEVVPALKASLERANLSGRQVVIIAFDLATVKAAKSALPPFDAFWLRGYDGNKDEEHDTEIVDVIRRATEAGLDGLNLARSWPIDDAFVQKVKAAGLKLYVWTVNDPILGKSLLNAGIDGLTTDRCGSMRQQLCL